MKNSKIEWTDSTWNCISGCSPASPGCEHCYAARMSRRLAAMGQKRYAGLVGPNSCFNGVVRCHSDLLDVPLRWKKPRMIFVNSMADTFHAGVPQWFIHDIFHTIKRCPQHTFQLLTKRPENAAKMEWTCAAKHDDYRYLRNVWMGCTVENQAMADLRIPSLVECRAAVRFLSVEPMLGPVVLPTGGGFHWVICGSENGPSARTMNPDWALSLLDQCNAYGVPFFFKGMIVNGKKTDLLDGQQHKEFPKQYPGG
jgi:protein gp37